MTAQSRSASARRPSGARPDVRCVDPVAAAAAAAFDIAAARISALSRERGRPGVIAALRGQAHDLSRTAVAEDQILSAALDAAAEDLTWGRPPLAAWLRRLTDPAAVTPAGRAVARSGQPAVDGDIAAAAAAVARELEARILAREADILVAARVHADRLEAAAALQLAASDDPRLTVTPALRAVLRESAFVLGRRAAPAAVPPWRRPSWRRLRLWRTWLDGRPVDAATRRREV